LLTKDVPLGNFGNNGFTNLRGTRCTVFCQRCIDDTLHALADAPTKLACPVERRTLPYQQPRAAICAILLLNAELVAKAINTKLLLDLMS
jgi:hypothetical protein